MVLIDQQEAAKLIRQNKDTHEDCQGAIHYNIGCEHSAQIVERMKGQEIICCKDCKYSIDEYNDGDCYCKRPSRELVWIGKSWDFFCQAGRRKT